jgi:hypothetical protein
MLFARLLETDVRPDAEGKELLGAAQMRRCSASTWRRSPSAARTAHGRPNASSVRSRGSPF